MKTSFSKRGRAANHESGQVMLFTVLGLGLFLIGSMAFAIDMSNMWFHRQAAQTAADAACTAGAMDMLQDQTNSISAAPYPGHFTPGGSLSCNTTSPNSGTPGTSNPSPCVYAALNGYTSNITNSAWQSGTLGNDVEVNTCWASKACSSPAPPPGVTTTQYMEVDVYENMPTFFLGLLKGKTTQSIRAVSKCGVNISAAPIPIIVLDPIDPDSKTSAFNTQGNPATTIYGGPQQSIQVNSSDESSTEAVTIGGSAFVDLRQGGPQHTGSSFGVKGGPTTPPTCSTGGSGSGFCSGSTGSWMSPHSTIEDPLRNLQPPSATEISNLTTYAGSNKGAFTSANAPGGMVADGTDGCAGNGGSCVVFLPGNYTNGICLGSSCGGGGAQYGVFREGLYYMQGNFTLDSNSCVRMSQTTTTGTYAGWGGVTFYFVGNNTLSVAANSGKPGANSCDPNQPFSTTSGTGPFVNGVYCDSTAAKPGNSPGNVPSTLTGNVFVAPCTGEYGDQNYVASKGRQHGVLFFQDRSATGLSGSGGPNAGGGGAYGLVGTMYFHSCDSTGKAASCTFPTGTYNNTNGNYFRDTFQLGGGSGSQSYVLGEIIIDNLVLQGGGSIYMDLNPSTVNNIYKAALYQ